MGKVLRRMIQKASQTTKKFCDNPLCPNHVEVAKGMRVMTNCALGKGEIEIYSHDYIKVCEILHFCDVCKKAIQMVE